VSMRVRHVDKSIFKNYLRKAEECFEAASECLRKWAVERCGYKCCSLWDKYL